MSQGWLLVFGFVIVLALIPIGLKWLQRRIAGAGFGGPATARIVSAVAVGPHQRVVTVELGPEGERIWLTLGVTTQSITCLHTQTLVPTSRMVSCGAELNPTSGAP